MQIDTIYKLKKLFTYYLFIKMDLHFVDKKRKEGEKER